MKTNRKSEHAIDPIYLNRWSPRAFDVKEVEEEKLNAVLEAARWAPSAANWQPWHYVVATEKQERDKFLTFIVEGNLVWCMHAPVLIAILSKKVRTEAGDINPFHAFDAGTSWGYLSLEASRQGLITHAMGGFDADKARVELNIPQEYEINAVVALGYQGDKHSLPAAYQEREVASDRHDLQDIISKGTFK